MKKMMQFLTAVMLAPAMALAANMVTYTATSKVSQKDADKKAMEGAAMQISSSVKASMETVKTEDKNGNVQSTYSSKKTVESNVLLKGAKITVGPKKNGEYTSTVSVDLDQLSSAIIVDLQQMKKQAKSLDSLIRDCMLDRDYRRMTMNMSQLEKLTDAYSDRLNDLSYFQTVSQDMILESTLAELSDFLMESMQTVSIKTNLTDKALVVTVNDFAGPIEYFPITLTQDRKDLLTDKTNVDGKVVFPLKDVMKNKPSGEVVVHPDMNFKFVRQSALANKTVSYQSEKQGCKYNFSCLGEIAECGAVQKFLDDAGLNVSSEYGLPELDAVLTFSDKPNSAKTLYTSRGTIAIRYGSTEMVEQVQGVGKDPESAHIQAVKKLPATKILNTFATKGCTK
ncbi:hypothetical protein [Fibrobacter sp. UWEL]|uniref:hypothetical protein n=1 Tax=Fibrobacter sp. UWEL TaxID=1896209 RepID=UPI00090FAC99|nr:hypothetical protein [Fibrobacter sp. UWEL]SHK30890.1 hypothetical protein SAMN05720468_10163 [Fibrobacter sp. UWEL]